MKVMEVTTNRTFKSRLFKMIFSDRQELLALYNATLIGAEGNSIEHKFGA